MIIVLHPPPPPLRCCQCLRESLVLPVARALYMRWTKHAQRSKNGGELVRRTTDSRRRCVLRIPWFFRLDLE
jgi:hypothetical protein